MAEESIKLKHARQVEADVGVRVDQRVYEMNRSKRSIRHIIQSPEFQLCRKFLKPHSLKIASLFLLSLAQASLATTLLVLVMVFVRLTIGDGITEDGKIPVFGFELELPYADVLSTSSTLYFVLFLSVGVIIISVSLIRLIQKHYALKLQHSFIRSLRMEAFEKLLMLEIGYFTSTRIGDTAYLQNTIIGRTAPLISFTFELLNATINSIVVAAILFKMSLPLALVLIGAAVLLHFSTGSMRRKSRGLSFQVSEKSKNAGSLFLELVHGIRLIRQGHQEERARNEYQHAAEERETAILKLSDYQNVVRSTIEISSALGLILFIMIGQYIAGTDVLADMGFTVGFFVVAWGALSNVQKASDLGLRMGQMLPYLSMVAEFLYDKSHIRSLKNSTLPPAPDITRSIDVRNISFGYEQADQLFDGVSASFPSGSLTALVGLSGSGKSTLLEMLAGFQYPDTGSIELDGQDRENFSMNTYRARVGYVTQDMILFNSSIRENLLFFKPDATGAEIERALKVSCADEFVNAMPQGLDSMVGERGMQISGGQRQRLSLARVLLQETSVLLLDEATSALDLVTESAIYKNLRVNMASRIIIVAAHRLSAIKDFDNIIVFSDGKIIEQGTHDELMALDGLYHGMYRIQQLSADHD